MKKDYRAFTLAEVLITLGIIGVVAALTIPVIARHNRKITVETRLKAFYSTINQAIRLSESENDEAASWIFYSDTEEEHLRTFYNTYLKKYLKTTDVKFEGSACYPDYNVLKIYFPNGSGAEMQYGAKDYVFFPNAKDMDSENCTICKNAFYFGFYPAYNTENNPAIPKFITDNYRYKGMEPYLGAAPVKNWDGNIDNLMANEIGHCTKVIQMNGWKIPDNYPIRF